MPDGVQGRVGPRARGAWPNDPHAVREQYASEAGLAARSSLYASTTGPFAGDVALAALAEVSPRRSNVVLVADAA